MHLVVGLGNPGREYEQTRHNVGFRVVDRVGARAGVDVDRKQFGALVAPARVAGRSAVLAKPQSYMNRSGEPAASLRGYYKATNPEIVVVHDDLDLPFGEVRVKVGGGHGGHNGLRDLTRALGADYVRVRFGIGRPPKGWDAADYVLGKWAPAEAEALEAAVDRAAEAVELVLDKGPTPAMNTFNVRSGREDGGREPGGRNAGAASPPSDGPVPSRTVPSPEG
jgi:PTH1 family peptidyl-tRNA hydrolase